MAGIIVGWGGKDEDGDVPLMVRRGQELACLGKVRAFYRDADLAHVLGTAVASSLITPERKESLKAEIASL